MRIRVRFVEQVIRLKTGGLRKTGAAADDLRRMQAVARLPSVANLTRARRAQVDSLMNVF